MKTEQIIEEVNKIAEHFSFLSDPISNKRYALLKLAAERLKDYEIRIDKAEDIVNEMLATLKNFKP